MIDTIPPDAALPTTPSAEPVLRPEARVVRADRSLAAMVLVICTLGGMGVGFGFAMYLMRAQLAYAPLCGGHFAPVVQAAQRDDVKTWLGVTYRRLPDHTGSIILHVYADTAAEAAGLQPGDVLTSFDGEDLRDSGDLRDAVLAHNPGEVVPIALERSGQPVVLKARLGFR
jgi:predicted metalloprotease with PDZ domain